jgi:CHASE2 domain-containing sensor protein
VESKRGTPVQRAVRIVTVLIIAGLGFQFEDFKDWFPWMRTLQVRSYNWISKLGVRKPRPQWVLGVEIDDATFFQYLNLNKGDVTDRAAVARLVKIAAHADAAVIALDLNISRENMDSFEPRKSQNQQFLDAIKEAEALHVPVVLTFGFENRGPARHPEPNIFSNDELPDFGKTDVPYRTRVGFDEAASEPRAVPLVVPGKNVEDKANAAEGRDGKKNDVDYSAFGLEIVNAYEDSLGIVPRTRDKLGKQIARHQFVYTSFLPQAVFPKISAQDLLTGKAAPEMLRHRIVIIGGNRHISKDATEWLDNGLVPLEMRGMYRHANRVEGLLDNRLFTPVSPLLALFFDLGLGTLMVYYSGRSTGLSRRLGTLGVFFIPVALAYVASINLGYVVDSVLPLLLLFLHGFIDHYLELRGAAQAAKAQSA